MVRTADRTVDIFEHFARLQKPATVSELARELGLPVSSCFSLVRTLVDRGYLYYLQPRGALYPTRRVSLVADSIASHDPIVQYIRPFLKALRDKAGETVIFGKLQGVGVVYLELIESLHPVRYSMNVGSIRELHASSIGKAILAALADEPRRRLMAKIKYARLTDRTLRTQAQLVRSVEDGRRRGYWTNDGESAPDVMGIARSMHVLGDFYGVALVGPRFRFAKNLKPFVEALSTTTAKIAEVCAHLDRP